MLSQFVPLLEYVHQNKEEFVWCLGRKMMIRNDSLYYASVLSSVDWADAVVNEQNKSVILCISE